MGRTHITLSAAMRARDVSRPRPGDAESPPDGAPSAESTASGPETGDGGSGGSASRQRGGPAAPARPDDLVVPPPPRPRRGRRARRRR
ncbi:hypothetical protein J0910_10065 [Nocardiopsis sp. CNT-189]|uniref:hypothetical protein n=1 Tax=Nocardiopsis oceanisediminis TaxID=2816862 RepID=UPI003B2A5C9C